MIRRKITLYFTSKAFDAVVSFLALIVVAREMGPTPIGIIGYCAGIIGMFSLIAGLGFTTTHRKKISEGGDLGYCIGTYSTIKISSILIWVMLFILWIFYSKFIEKDFILSSDAEMVLYIVALYTIIFQFTDIFTATYIGKGEMAKSSIPEVISRLFTALSKIAVAFLGMGVIFLAASQLFGYILLLGILLWFFRSYPIKFPTYKHLKDYFTFTVPLFLIVMMAVITVNLDRIMIGYYWGFEEVSYYTVPLKLSQILLLISSSFSAVLFPMLSKKNAEGDYTYIRETVPLIERYILLILTPPVIFILIYAELITLTLFGEEFLPSAILLKYLTLISYMGAITRPYTTQIVSIGRVKLSLVIGIAIFLPHAILNFVFIPEKLFGYDMLGLGATGAAIATLVGSIFGLLVSRFFSYYTLNIKQNSTVFISFLLSGIIMGSIMVIVKIHFDVHSLPHVFLLAIFSTLFYLLSLMVFNQFGRKEFEIITSGLNIFKMKKYITNEIK